MAIPVPYPLINGVRYDHSSLDVRLDAVQYFGLKAIDYSDNLEPGEVYGTLAQLLARTRGQYKVTASFELYRAEYDAFASLLSQRNPGVGLYEISFNIDVHMLPEGGLAMVTDNIVGNRIKSVSNSSSAGSEALSVKVELHTMYLVKNGISPVTGLRK